MLLSGGGFETTLLSLVLGDVRYVSFRTWMKIREEGDNANFTAPLYCQLVKTRVA